MHQFYSGYGQYGETSADGFDFSEDAKRVRKYFMITSWRTEQAQSCRPSARSWS
jgi:hypothetical protein